MKEHVCTLPNDPATMQFITSVMSLKDLTFKEIWINLFRTSNRTPKTKIFLDSMAAVFAKRRRHAAHKYWWIDHTPL